jgi:hypothetical protein
MSSYFADLSLLCYFYCFSSHNNQTPFPTPEEEQRAVSTFVPFFPSLFAVKFDVMQTLAVLQISITCCSSLFLPENLTNIIGQNPKFNLY